MSDFDEASGDEQRLRPGVESRRCNPVGAEASHVDGMTLHGCGTVVPSELDSSLEQG